MLTSQLASGEFQAGHGRPSLGVAEPPSGLAAIPGGINRQRLAEWAERLARVQALGGEYARVDFSPELAQLVRQGGR